MDVYFPFTMSLIISVPSLCFSFNNGLKNNKIMIVLWIKMVNMRPQNKIG